MRHEFCSRPPSSLSFSLPPSLSEWCYGENARPVAKKPSINKETLVVGYVVPLQQTILPTQLTPSWRLFRIATHGANFNPTPGCRAYHPSPPRLLQTKLDRAEVEAGVIAGIAAPKPGRSRRSLSPKGTGGPETKPPPYVTGGTAIRSATERYRRGRAGRKLSFHEPVVAEPRKYSSCLTAPEVPKRNSHETAPDAPKRRNVQNYRISRQSTKVSKRNFHETAPDAPKRIKVQNYRISRQSTNQRRG